MEVENQWKLGCGNQINHSSEQLLLLITVIPPLKVQANLPKSDNIPALQKVLESSEVSWVKCPSMSQMPANAPCMASLW